MGNNLLKRLEKLFETVVSKMTVLISNFQVIFIL